MHKRGRDSIALAELTVISTFLPTVVVISVRRARFLLRVGCGCPQIRVGQAPVSPLGRQRTTKTPAPDRPHHPSAAAAGGRSASQGENDVVGGRHDVLPGLPRPSHQGLHVADNEEEVHNQELSRC